MNDAAKQKRDDDPAKPPTGKRKGAAYLRWWRAAVANGKPVSKRRRTNHSMRAKKRRVWMRKYMRQYRSKKATKGRK